VIVQFGGQTPLNLSLPLTAAGVHIIGTTPESIDLAEDRKRFGKLLEELDIPQAPGAMVASVEEAVEAAKKIGFPVLVRPSYVLGGRAMVIAYDEDTIQQYMKQAVEYSQDRPVLIDKFLEDAIEVDVDALSDGEDVVIGGIMQHIEEAGIHSGDSSCVLPAVDIPEPLLKRMREYTFQLARALKVIGLMNVQFAIPRMARGGTGVPARPERSQSLCARSQPARLAHRSLRIESHRRAHGEDCRASHDRPQAARIPAGKYRARYRPRHRPLLLREVSGVPLVKVSRR
jgi:carbamoyl-phosphate synthase large subunit